MQGLQGKLGPRELEHATIGPKGKSSANDAESTCSLLENSRGGASRGRKSIRRKDETRGSAQLREDSSISGQWGRGNFQAEGRYLAPRTRAISREIWGERKLDGSLCEALEQMRKTDGTVVGVFPVIGKGEKLNRRVSRELAEGEARLP